MSGEVLEKIWGSGQLLGDMWGRSWDSVEEKWGWVLCGMIVYKVLKGCGEYVDFHPTNYPHFICPTKVK